MSDCQCQKCTWTPEREKLVNEYIIPNHIQPGTPAATEQMIRVLQSEIASLRGVIDRLNAKVEKLQGELVKMQGEQH